MTTTIWIIVATLAVLLLGLSLKVVKQYELGVDKNSTVVFPAPLMSTIGELGSFLARENAAAGATPSNVTATPAHDQPLPAQPLRNGKATLAGATP
ncbi:hypothetical protein AB0A95_16255 [Micromonospora sp. NPDC049230]|uniref:hypothetical protein n=1 Tax=Micromonospora sp. NPDC049230 TaxID=3155502 RepID=UPI0033F8B400